MKFKQFPLYSWSCNTWENSIPESKFRDSDGNTFFVFKKTQEENKGKHRWDSRAE